MEAMLNRHPEPRTCHSGLARPERSRRDPESIDPEISRAFLRMNSG